MADTYIDYDETRIYGDYAIEQIAQHVVGRLREFDPGIHYAVSALRAATDLVAAHLHAARAGDAPLHEEINRREEPIHEARDTLMRFAKHLESHRAGTVPYGAFFVEPAGTLSRRGPQRLQAALDHVLGSLDEFGGAVRDAGYWRDEIARDRAALESVIHFDRALRRAPVDSPALDAARAQWLAVYESVKHLVAAVLTLTGSPIAMDEVFDDLANVHHAEGALDDEPATTADAPSDVATSTAATE